MARAAEMAREKGHEAIEHARQKSKEAWESVRSKGMNALDALTQLQHANKKSAPILAKLIQSAIANAKNNFSLDTDHLYIKSLTTDMGTVMKRYFFNCHDHR